MLHYLPSGLYRILKVVNENIFPRIYRLGGCRQIVVIVHIEEVEFPISEKLDNMKDIDLPNMNTIGCITKAEQKNLNCFENFSHNIFPTKV